MNKNINKLVLRIEDITKAVNSWSVGKNSRSHPPSLFILLKQCRSWELFDVQLIKELYFKEWKAPWRCTGTYIKYKSKLQDMLRNLNRSTKEAARIKFGPEELQNCTMSSPNASLFNTMSWFHLASHKPTDSLFLQVSLCPNSAQLTMFTSNINGKETAYGKSILRKLLMHLKVCQFWKSSELQLTFVNVTERH